MPDPAIYILLGAIVGILPGPAFKKKDAIGWFISWLAGGIVVYLCALAEAGNA